MVRPLHIVWNEASTSCGTTVPCFLPHNTFVFALSFDIVLRELRHFSRKEKRGNTFIKAQNSIKKQIEQTNQNLLGTVSTYMPASSNHPALYHYNHPLSHCILPLGVVLAFESRPEHIGKQVPESGAETSQIRLQQVVA
ncbi:hypothetical protein Barb4_00751 [Bacteroidales bacterium Barb4]|nr:hypothetical protein Barb4_00751 [Bacteroidales bacterium Barb4]